MVTIPEIAAYLGVTPGYIRQVIALHGIKRAGRHGRHGLYWVAEVVRHTGTRDRLAHPL